jgi:putative phage-type endonuclease
MTTMRIISGPEAQQGTPEWLKWRQGGLGASDAPVVMGRSPWSTPYQLFRKKIGLDTDSVMTPAMARGIRLEPKARRAYERATGEPVVPLAAESLTVPVLRASLDGMAFTGDFILEIKCPGEKAHAMALQGMVPDYYVDQLQQQMFVAGVDLAHYWSFDGDQGTLIEVRRDQARIDRLVEAALRFWDHVKARKWASDEWEAAAAVWRRSNELLEAAKAEEDNARRMLLSLFGADESKREGGGVIVTRVNRKGSVDYEAALASKGVAIPTDELEPFRKKGSSSIQVREAAIAEPLDERVLKLPAASAASSKKENVEEFILVV